MTHPPGGSGGGSTGSTTGPGRIALRLIDFALDSLASIFKALPRGARR